MIYISLGKNEKKISMQKVHHKFKGENTLLLVVLYSYIYPEVFIISTPLSFAPNFLFKNEIATARMFALF